MVLSALCPQTNLATDFVGRWELCRHVEDVAAATLLRLYRAVKSSSDPSHELFHNLSTQNQREHLRVHSHAAPQEHQDDELCSLIDSNHFDWHWRLIAIVFNQIPTIPHNCRVELEYTQAVLRDRPRYLEVNISEKESNQNENLCSAQRARGRFVSRRSMALLEAYVNSVILLQRASRLSGLYTQNTILCELRTLFCQVGTERRKSSFKRSKLPSVSISKTNSGTLALKSDAKAKQSSGTSCEKIERQLPPFRANPKRSSQTQREVPAFGSPPPKGWIQDRCVELMLPYIYELFVHVKAQYEIEPK